jgi:hypothetical protein
MKKLFCILSIFIIFVNCPIYAQNQALQISTSFGFNSVNFLGLQSNSRSSDKGISKLGIKYDAINLSSQITLNYDGYNNFSLDDSYLQYTSGIATFGVGAINRNWSFSDNTSLILSQNARPINSIYLKLENDFKYDWLPSEANWSFEAFNGFNEGGLNNTSSMLAGLRAVLTPFEGLEFELVQTSQWGGKGQNTGISSIGAALLTDTNVGSNSNINKMAGFGISYKIPPKIIPLRLYGQAIGEDEAGNFPSCYAYLAGFEWSNSKFKYPIALNFEVIDTRVDKTTHGFCGPNTMYNNVTYDYTNYGKTIGTAIDTEGTSLDLYLRSHISEEVNIEFATKSVVVNDANWQGHRLSPNRQSGFISSLGVSWAKNNIIFNGNIYNQGFNLDKANIKNGYGVSFSSSIIF